MAIFDGAIFDSAVFDTGAAAASITYTQHGRGTSYAYKTLSQIREEEKAEEARRVRLDKAKAEKARQAKLQAAQEAAALRLMEQAAQAEMARQVSIAAQNRLMQFMAEQDEDDAEALLLAA